MDLITVEETAKLLGMNRSSVYKLIRRTKDPLPAYKLGGIRIDQSELIDWLSHQRMQAAA